MEFRLSNKQYQGIFPVKNKIIDLHHSAEYFKDVDGFEVNYDTHYNFRCMILKDEQTTIQVFTSGKFNVLKSVKDFEAQKKQLDVLWKKHLKRFVK